MLLRGSRWALLRRVGGRAGRPGPGPRRGAPGPGGHGRHRRRSASPASCSALLAGTGRRAAVTAVAQPDGRRRPGAAGRRAPGLDVELVAAARGPDRPDARSRTSSSARPVRRCGSCAASACRPPWSASPTTSEAGYGGCSSAVPRSGWATPVPGLDHDAAAATLRRRARRRARCADSLAAARPPAGRRARRLAGRPRLGAARRDARVAGRAAGRRTGATGDRRRRRALLPLAERPGDPGRVPHAGAVGPEQHRAWLAATLADPGRHLLVASDGAGRRRDGAVGPRGRRRVGGLARRSRPSAGAGRWPGRCWRPARTGSPTTSRRRTRCSRRCTRTTQPSLRLFESAGYLPDLPPDDGRASSGWSSSGCRRG